jgi:hypothetical protein
VKGKIEAAANIIVIVFAVVVGSVFLKLGLYLATAFILVSLLALIPSWHGNARLFGRPAQKLLVALENFVYQPILETLPRSGV